MSTVHPSLRSVQVRASFGPTCAFGLRSICNHPSSLSVLPVQVGPDPLLPQARGENGLLQDVQCQVMSVSSWHLLAPFWSQASLNLRHSSKPKVKLGLDSAGSFLTVLACFERKVKSMQAKRPLALRKTYASTVH
eukprot:48088-Pelagomonas_calceolata.AAC.6